MSGRAPRTRSSIRYQAKKPPDRAAAGDLARKMLLPVHIEILVGYPPNEESLVSTLQKVSVVAPLTLAKPSGLAEFGAPLDAAASVKKGRVHEFAQLLDGGEIGRRFQDLRVICVRTVEGGVPSAKVVVQFEAFGDNTAAPPNGAGFDARLLAGFEQLASFASGSLFLPYANFWYSNRFVFEVSLADFDRADALEFIAQSETVRVL